MVALTEPSTVPTEPASGAFTGADWDLLIQALKDGNVIPVIGPDALLVEVTDADSVPQTLPFYRLIAADLLKSFQLAVDPALLEHTWALHKAVNQVLAQKGGLNIEQRVRREVSRLIAQRSPQVQPAAALRQLAGIGAFSLFVSLTPDDLLKRAMANDDDAANVRVNSFSPRDASESLADLSLLRRGERGIFQPLGAYGNAAIGFAIHEEDTLEHLYRLQSDAARRFAALLSELRRRDKLLIGCNFPDWLGRAMLRLFNDNRFYSQEKFTSEFLLPSADDSGLKAFLSQYSPNTLGFDDPTEAFIEKLALRFPSATPTTQPKPNARASGGPTVFVSYASENAEAARRIADALVNLGFSDVWLDKKKLIGGDDWADRIEDAVETCDFFMPLLSAEANSRREGVFWEEWNMAVRRARRIQDAFLLPVGIDNEAASKTRYARIDDRETRVFFDKHLFHAPGGFFDTDQQDALQERCRRFREAAND
ncbi:toll/interleukin-1 receptor domain-containing protein [Methylomonas methanica]|uniref:TIR domain-containing protein n=1 Tax=Methylomonas methanica (strain DSM 25384 / MC09) TaxID=857087 RepID=G0A0R4_METMM|nr:toll/interleukin-1 receptor domain-containing protein [Methylomonas methanica]AEF99998.1 hypothetical protein Metme_1579 [Methylomonas methanica MC09]